MTIQRTLNILNLLKNKSFLLLGPRATGKSFLIKQQVSTDNTLLINLLRSDERLLLLEKPSHLEAMIAAKPGIALVVIDEVQLVPELLNEVHRLIEEQGTRFLLTGSSARKLKGKGVNLLAGRAWQAELFPLTYHEIPSFDLAHYLQYGGLPPVYLSAEPKEELVAYVETYLQQEIQAEAVVRKIPAFSRFLRMSALTSGQQLNFATLSSDTGVPASTVREYYTVLEDTLLGFMVPPWHKSQKRKPVSTAKFYYFDIGVKNQLAGITHIDPKTAAYGDAFEHFIAMELRAFISYKRLHEPLTFWRTSSGLEVDFIIGDAIAIEVKTTEKVHDKHIKNLKYLQEENVCKQYYLISHDRIDRDIDNIKIRHWESFLKALWRGEIMPS